MFVISVCGSIWVSIVNVDVVGQCIYCCCYRCEHGFVSLDMRTKMLIHLFVVLAYADNDCKTVLLHLIRGPMTEMASLITKECDSSDRCMCFLGLRLRLLLPYRSSSIQESELVVAMASEAATTTNRGDSIDECIAYTDNYPD